MRKGKRHFYLNDSDSEVSAELATPFRSGDNKVQNTISRNKYNSSSSSSFEQETHVIKRLINYIMWHRIVLLRRQNNAQLIWPLLKRFQLVKCIIIALHTYALLSHHKSYEFEFSLLSQSMVRSYSQPHVTNTLNLLVKIE